MMHQLRTAWSDYIRPMLRRPERVQIAALCHRGDGPAREVLLVTSRDTGRWILPKGWPIRGQDAAGTALQEAWEEAGVRRGRAAEAIGSYCYDKGLDGDWAVAVRTYVIPVAVEEMSDTYPEARERRREWVRPSEAAARVAEPELRAILATF
ncbi:NUDIX domain-containing protein [Rhodobacterales bacterium HKCCE2091]|nr:NUDIX domain-containing protein [Rhodobacterales bacterium HKCCE2091]